MHAPPREKRSTPIPVRECALIVQVAFVKRDQYLVKRDPSLVGTFRLGLKCRADGAVHGSREHGVRVSGCIALGYRSQGAGLCSGYACI